MIINRYDLEEGRLTEEIVREIEHLAETVTKKKFDILELKFSIKKIEGEEEYPFA